MSRSHLRPLLLILGAPLQALLASTSSFAAAPPVQSWWLDNGARVLFIAAPDLPIVNTRVVFNAGAARDGDLPGLALVTNGMLAEGANGLNTDQIARTFEDMGAQFSNSSHRDMSLVSLTSLSDTELLNKAAIAVGDILAKPDFPEAAFQRIKRQLLIGLQNLKQSPRGLGSRAFWKTLYSDHPYAHYSAGTEASIKAMTLSDLQQFHKRYFVGRNATVAIVGDLDLIGAARLAEKLVSQLPAGESPSQLPLPTPPAPSSQQIDFPSSQAHITTGQIGVTRKDSDYFSLYLGNHILGGSGLVSLLSDELRERRGLTYSVGSALSPMSSPGPFLMSVQTRADQVDEALNVMRETAQKFITNGPNEEQMEAAIKNITGSFPLSTASNASLVSWLSSIGFYNLPLDYIDLFPARISTETADSVRKAMQERIKLDEFITVVVGPRAKASTKDNDRQP